MHQVTLEEAAGRLSELIRQAGKGDEIIITQNSEPIAKIVSLPPRPRPQFGSAKELLIYMADDFEATPEEFKEYTE